MGLHHDVVAVHLLPGPLGGGEEVPRHVARRDADAAAQRHRQVGIVLAHALRGGQHLVHVHPDGRGAGHVAQRRVHEPVQGEHDADHVVTRHHRDPLGGGGDVVLPRRVVRGDEVLRVLVAEGVLGEVPHAGGHGDERPREGLHRGLGPHLEGHVRLADAERVDTGAEVVLERPDARRGQRRDAVGDQLLVLVGRRTGPQLVLRSPHRVVVRELGAVGDVVARDGHQPTSATEP